MRSSWGTVCLAAAATLATGALGCVETDRSIRFSTIADQHLIFNPEFTEISPNAIARAEWPVAHVYDSMGEIVEYRTTMRDQQSHSGHGRDRLTRTFSSVRRGKARR